MDIQAYEDFLQSIDSMTINKMIFRYEKVKESGFMAVKSALDDAKELGSFGERSLIKWVLSDSS